MKKIGILTGALAMSFDLTGCNLFMKMKTNITTVSQPREGVTYAEFHAAAEEADKKSRNYIGFVCSGEFPDKNVYLDPTTIYFSELEEKEKNPATWQEELSIELFLTYGATYFAHLLSPKATDDIFYVYDYGFKYMSDINYAGYIIEFNSDGVIVDFKQGHGESQQHVHFVWIGGPSHPSDE